MEGFFRNRDFYFGYIRIADCSTMSFFCACDVFVALGMFHLELILAPLFGGL